ncbi:hypothetical protein OJ998_01010 [Solirubrobacter taibaiensis]|nr:hypothetical protein [Solirubrobacter taibaiensis]
MVLYDRLVVPVPPKDDEDEWQRWREKDWKPDLQGLLLDELEDYVRRIPWSDRLREDRNAMGVVEEGADPEVDLLAVAAAQDTRSRRGTPRSAR